MELDNQNEQLSVHQDSSNFLSPLVTNLKEIASGFRKRKSAFEFKSVHPADEPQELEKGWEVQRVGTRTTRLKRKKKHYKWLEDRIWCLMKQMGYQTLNGDHFHIRFTRSDGSVGKKQVDVYAEDDETVLVVECKSKEQRGRRSLQKDIQETISLKRYFRDSINKRAGNTSKRKIIWVYATNNILWSSTDIERAGDGDISIITENELQYFETFIKHMGPAGRYQILGEFLKGQKVPNLNNVRGCTR